MRWYHGFILVGIIAAIPGGLLKGEGGPWYAICFGITAIMFGAYLVFRDRARRGSQTRSDGRLDRS
jgi:hypothetical protein